MFRKTVIALTTAATLALGLGTAASTANANHRHHGFNGGVVIVIGGNHWHSKWHCHWVKVKSHGHWIKVKRCHSHRHDHRNHH